MNGWHGRLLHVDLGAGDVHIEPLRRMIALEDWCRNKFLERLSLCSANENSGVQDHEIRP